MKILRLESQMDLDFWICEKGWFQKSDVGEGANLKEWVRLGWWIKGEDNQT